ncbi:MAG: ATP-dependent RNA helicase HrpA [Planctomycetota bacterium]
MSVEADIKGLRSRLRTVMRADHARLARRLKGLERKSSVRALDAVRTAIDASANQLASRRAAVPDIEYPEDLPVSQRRAEIMDAIDANQVVVLCGETGSGKTTQLPKMCLELGRGVDRTIVHTQPRRVAARTVAGRIADELGVPLGGAVGWRVRFAEKTGPNTLVKLVTDGVLLAETQQDRFFDAYDTIIVDEAHERSLNIDFLLGYLAKLLPRRPDLKVIVTSATIDPQRFSEHFSGAPIIEVSGRTYPVETRYRPLNEPLEGDEGPDRAALSVYEGVERALRELDRNPGGGDTLVFMPGEREIRETAEHLRKHYSPEGGRTEVLPLYARLSRDEQDRVFKPNPSRRRIVISTNVAETSVTVPGIRAVIDPGTARINRYSPRNKTQRLEVEPVSQASAEQRKGRCGRVGPGVCVRLFSEGDFSTREPFTLPEIARTSLASVILRMESLRLGSIEQFPFVEPPDGRLVRDGYDTLFEIGAIDEGRRLTDVGRKLANFPVDPRIGRIMLAGAERGCLREALVIASFLSVQDPRERPLEKRSEADEKHERFAEPTSDFVAVLRLWDHYHELKDRLSASRLRKACRAEFISWLRVREWTDTHRQLRELMTESGHRPGGGDVDPSEVHRALLTGLLSSIGKRTTDGDYGGPRGARFRIHPASGVHGQPKPEFLVASELVRTTQLYARLVAKVEPGWIEDAGPHLVKREHREPEYDERSQRVYCKERLTLWGVELFGGRRVPMGPVDPIPAREVFIHEALVEGRYRSRAKFLDANLALQAEVERMEAKTRRPDYLADARARFSFYGERIPKQIVDGKQFERWIREREREEPGTLVMHRRDLLRPDAPEVEPSAFPDRLDVFGEKLEIGYRLEPGAEDDGVTVTVPLAQLAQVDPARAEWLVPGLLPQKLDQIVRSMPKALRRASGGPSEFAGRFMAGVRFGDGTLREAIAGFLSRTIGEPVDASKIPIDAADEALRMRFRVVDEQGTELGAGRDLEELRRRLQGELRRALAAIPGAGFNRDGLTGWDFDELPERIEREQSGRPVIGYPAIIDRGHSASLRLLETAEEAERATRIGVRRLFLLAAKEELRHQVRHLPGIERARLLYGTMGAASELDEAISELTADRAFVRSRPLPRTAADFEKRLDKGWGELGRHAHDALALGEAILAEHQGLQASLSKQLPEAWSLPVADLRAQAVMLVPKRFLVAVPADWVGHIPRYLRGARMRLDRLRGGGLERDIAAMRTLAPLWRAYTTKSREHLDRGLEDPALERYRWMLEELRVSLFAQQLGTSVSVSPAKLAKQFERVR